MLDREGTARPERRSALIDRELERYNVDIAALSETRLADVGEEPESTYTFFWSGKPAAEKREWRCRVCHKVQASSFPKGKA